MNKEEDEPTKTPVTVLSGYLGSGKTTLVNYILNEQKDKKIAVIENEFGEISIDTELVGENIAVEEDIITMDNGCVCCTVKGDLLKALRQLSPRRHEFECILLETTGIADPAPIIATFENDPFTNENYHIDAVITLVDAKNVIRHLDEKRDDGTVNEAQQQLAFADKIVLNKIDLVTRKQLRTVKRRINAVNAFADVIEAQQSRVELTRILNLDAFDIQRALDIDENILEEDEEVECSDPDCDLDHDHKHDHGHDHKHDHGHDHKHDHGHDHKHDHGHDDTHHAQNHEHKPENAHTNDKHTKKRTIDSESTAAPPKKKKKHDLNQVGSVGFRIEGNLDVEVFNMTLAVLLTSRKDDIFRSKGVVAIEGKAAKFVFQGVHENITFGPSSKVWNNESRISKFVFIGKNLVREELLEMMQRCVFPVMDRNNRLETLIRTLKDLRVIPESSDEDEDDEETEREFQRQMAMSRCFTMMAWNVRRTNMQVPEYVQKLVVSNMLPPIVANLPTDRIIRAITSHVAAQVARDRSTPNFSAAPTNQ